MKKQLLQIETDYNNTQQVEAKQQVISSLKIVIFCALRAPHLGFCCEGDIGGYPVSQYRKKNWQIPKYRVENRRNTDTAIMIVHAYLKL